MLSLLPCESSDHDYHARRNRGSSTAGRLPGHSKGEKQWADSQKCDNAKEPIGDHWFIGFGCCHGCAMHAW
jgi:hypothetical protein